jgi:hypothetical protein
MQLQKIDLRDKNAWNLGAQTPSLYHRCQKREEIQVSISWKEVQSRALEHATEPNASPRQLDALNKIATDIRNGAPVSASERLRSLARKVAVARHERPTEGIEKWAARIAKAESGADD